jgi:hypothetical protein
MTLYEHGCKRENNKLMFEAAIHGIDLREPSKKTEKVEKPQNRIRTQSGIEETVERSQSGDEIKIKRTVHLPMFDDPNKYKNLSPEERQRLTDQMMGIHKKWVGEVEAKSKTVGGVDG